MEIAHLTLKEKSKKEIFLAVIYVIPLQWQIMSYLDQ